MEFDIGYVVITVLALIGAIPYILTVIFLLLIYFILRALVGD